ncbi:MAG: hypothetical protein HY928_13060 [Elusimicrobia bacterium]|nr:hypothetical protein [Elusimicrobiota bacterium]
MRTFFALTLVPVLACAAAAEPKTSRPLSRAAFISAVSATAVERLELRSLGTEARGMLEDPASWDYRTLMTAFVVGGGIAYFDGLRAVRRLGPVDAALRLRPASGRAGLELSWRGFPVTATTQLGAEGAQSFALQFRRAF